jgi:GNAT superfamily N-acetyltransferase
VKRTQDGRPEIRQACYADHAALKDFLGGLSLRARYLRFFTGAMGASPAMLRILAGGRDHIDAVVAVENDVIIGHAMASDATGPSDTVTEIGVVVTDACQGQGIGSALVRTLTARAQARGITTATMEVLAENRQVLAMIADHLPAAQHDSSGAYATIRVPLPQPGAERGGSAREPKGAVPPGLRSDGARNERGEGGASEGGTGRRAGPGGERESRALLRERLALRH